MALCTYASLHISHACAILSEWKVGCAKTCEEKSACQARDPIQQRMTCSFSPIQYQRYDYDIISHDWSRCRQSLHQPSRKQGNVQYCTPKFFSLTFSHHIIQPVQEQVKKAPSKQVMYLPPKTKFLPSERRRKKSSKTRNSGPGKTHRPSRQILKVMVG